LSSLSGRTQRAGNRPALTAYDARDRSCGSCGTWSIGPTRARARYVRRVRTTWRLRITWQS